MPNTKEPTQMTIFKTIATTTLTGLAAFGVASASLATPTVREVKEGSSDAHALKQILSIS